MKAMPDEILNNFLVRSIYRGRYKYVPPRYIEPTLEDMFFNLLYKISLYGK